ncbi:uncharacterized protein PG998_010899 [Apiospora kogelbergensis]|uniref:uncharacterized protein n=1 Tax=Apiospora kogelbergensis TaxID=1337665 RepID=UPI00312D05CF
MFSIQRRRRSFAVDSLLMEVRGHVDNNAPDNSKAHSPKQSYYYAVMTTSLVLIPSLGLIIWISKNSPALSHNYGLDSQPLGGRLTLVQAKAIDFVCSALIAPLTLVAINWYWFSVTRVTILSDGSTKAIPLAALVEASHTDTGSYSPMKLTSLVRSGRPKMVFLGILVLLSAVAQTCFSNVIAYEAYSVNIAQSSPLSLRALMTGLPITNMSPSRQIHTYNFTMAQEFDFKSQATSMLSRIAFAGTDGNLSNDTYVALNVTKASLDRLPPDIIGLEDVPTFQISIHCNATAPRSRVRASTKTYNRITASAVIDSGSMFEVFEAHSPGEVHDVANEWLEFQSWLGFNLKYDESYFFPYDALQPDQQHRYLAIWYD